VASSFLNELGISLVTHTVAIGSVSSALEAQLPTRKDLEKLDEDPVRCFDAETSKRMIAEIDECHKDGDTLGGVTETLVYGTPPGLGSFVHWDRRLDSQLAGALMGIQAIKGVEFGDGFETAKRRGSAAHDEIVREDGIARRLTDRAGGIEGGMSTGGVIRVRIAMKPISTVPKALQTIDITTGEATKAQHQRSDVCAVPAAGVVAEAMVALVVANSVLEKFGGDSIAETKRNMESYLENIPAELRSERLN
jgi:chorismate synthase